MGGRLEFVGNARGDLKRRCICRDYLRISAISLQPDMNILLLTLADLGSSIGESVTTIRLARALSEEGHVVTVLAPQASADNPVVNPGSVTIHYHWNIHRIGFPNSLNTLVQLGTVVWHKPWRQKDVLYVRAAMLTFLFGLYFRMFRSTTVVSEHHGWTEEERANSGRFAWFAPFERMAQVLDAKLAGKVRTVVPGIQALLEANGVPPGRVKVIGNACDTVTIHPLNRDEQLRARGLNPNGVYLGFIGNLAPWQGIDTLLEAIPLMAAKAPNVKLIIAGDGPERERLSALARQLNINERVEFLGRVDHALIHQVIACFDLALLPTENRGYSRIGRSPLKLREYAAAGRAVLAAHIPGVADLAAQPWLTLYQPGDAADLADRAVTLLNDSAALAVLGEQARAFAEANFAWPIVTRRLITELGLDVGDTSAIAPN